MQRELLSYLQTWFANQQHLPLLLRGARQVGKTYLIEQFGKLSFANIVNINFEESPDYKTCFTTLSPQEIITKIEIINKQKIVPGKTLLFLDEIQICPNAIIALRYFKEKLPDLHVIGAGSLLEFALRNQGMQMPVGRVQYLYLKQLSFREYLNVSGNNNLSEFLKNANLQKKIPDVIHDQALKAVREYMFIGGMPMVVDCYVNRQSLLDCQQYQTVILRTYSDDFAKYAATPQHRYLQQVFNQTPGLIGQQIKYVNIAADMDSRYLKSAISDLNKAGVIFSVFSTAASGLPLITHINKKKFKLLFFDIGLLTRATKLETTLLLNNQDLSLINKGAMAEQFVGQELIAYQDPYDEPQLYYWSREEKNSLAEVDYLINIDSQIVPIEVKSGKTGSLKSLHILMREKNLSLGVKISSQPLELNQKVLSIPFYMISELARLVKSVI